MSFMISGALTSSRAVSLSLRSLSLSSRDTGVWMREIDEGIDINSMAIQGDDTRWHIVREGGSSMQSDSKPRDFGVKICSLQDIKKKHDFSRCDGCACDELGKFKCAASWKIAELAADDPEEFADDPQFDSAWDVIGSIGEYADPSEATLDKDTRFFLAKLQKSAENFAIDASVKYYDEYHEEYREDLLTLLDFSEYLEKEEGDGAKGTDVALRLHEEGWEFDLGVRIYTADEIIGPGDGSGGGCVYVSGGVWVDGNSEWDRDYSPYLRAPLFRGLY